MRRLTKEVVRKRYENGQYKQFAYVCKQAYVPEKLSHILVSIYAIESFYRPLPFRIVEYWATACTGMLSIILGCSMKNYTIGKCQLGLATICNFYGAEYYQHQPRIQMKTIKTLRNAFSVIFLKNSVAVLSSHITPMLRRAQNIYPNNVEQQICYIGEQYNGEYSYGLMLYEIYAELFM